jgi:hypothetical protein
MDEYRAAVWLHNIDRCTALKEEKENAGGLRSYLAVLLLSADFSPEAKERITAAVLQHSKKDDELGDSTLLIALRIADKLDRFNPTGIVEAAASWGHLPIFDPQMPFSYDSAEAGEHGTAGHQSIYQTFFRVVEWIPMLPTQWARELISRDHLRLLITFLRLLGAQAAAQFNVPNRVEDDLRRALGPCYDWVNDYVA